MKTFLVLPHQLFNKKFLSEDFEYLLWEHPHYFQKYNYNKKKLMLHRASMKYYEDYLKTHGFKVKYCEFKTKPKYKDGPESIDQITEVSSNLPKTKLFKEALQDYR